jgi:hypothetical protein
MNENIGIAIAREIVKWKEIITIKFQVVDKSFSKEVVK